MLLLYFFMSIKTVAKLRHIAHAPHFSRG